MTIGVGMIGVTPGRSWGAIAHIPALHATEDFEIRAVCTTRMESAKAAASAFGFAQAFDNPVDLALAPDVDLVAVTVKVPHHRELVMAAIDAGKHVLCEWPLGNGLAEAEEMAAFAKRRGVRAFVGLQARYAPAIAYAKDLVAQGYVGRVLSSTLIGSGMSWGEQTDPDNAYNVRKSNGATLLTIPFGHSIDGFCSVLGEFAEVEAMVACQRTSITIQPGGQTIPMDAEDQVLAHGRLKSGVPVSVHYRGGLSRGTNFLWEINGTEGDLRITADVGHAQIFPLALSGAQGVGQKLEPIEVPQKYQARQMLAMPAQNVAELYAQIARDIAEGTDLAPTFEAAVHRHRFLDAIEKAAATGCRQSLE